MAAAAAVVLLLTDDVDGSEGQARSSSEIGAIASGAEAGERWRAWTAAEAEAAPWEQRPEAETEPR